MKKDQIHYRKAEKVDLKEVSNFRKHYFPYDSAFRSYETGYYEWKCFNNPFFKGEIRLAENKDGIVGMKSLTPKKLKYFNKIINGAETGDTFIQPDYQRKGILTSLFKSCIVSDLNKTTDFIYGTPNILSMPFYENKLNYQKLPLYVCNMVKPVFPKHYLNSKLKNPCLSIILSSLLKYFSLLLLSLSSFSLKSEEISLNREICIPNTMDLFWNSVSDEFEVMLVRNQKYLKWRYFKNPDTYIFMTARDNKHNIVGYIVTKLVDSGDKKTGYIVDYMVSRENPKIFLKLLKGVFIAFFDMNIDLVHVWVVKDSFYYNLLFRIGFIPHRRVHVVCQCKGNNKELTKKSLKWHFTLGDTDNI